MKKAWMFTGLLMAGCGGGGGSDYVEPSRPDPIAAPQALAAESDGQEVTVQWEGTDSAETYNLYYANERDLDPGNIGAHDGGTVVEDVTSPHTFTAPSAEAVYHLVVTAEENGRESGPSNEVIATPRYTAVSGGAQILDATTGITWDRCVYGQTWDGQTCTGTAQRLFYDEAQTVAADEGKAIPSAQELKTLSYCDRGTFPYAISSPATSFESCGHDFPKVTLGAQHFFPEPNRDTDSHMSSTLDCIGGAISRHVLSIDYSAGRGLQCTDRNNIYVIVRFREAS